MKVHAMKHIFLIDKPWYMHKCFSFSDSVFFIISVSLDESRGHYGSCMVIVLICVHVHIDFLCSSYRLHFFRDFFQTWQVGWCGRHLATLLFWYSWSQKYQWKMSKTLTHACIQATGDSSFSSNMPGHKIAFFLLSSLR